LKVGPFLKQCESLGRFLLSRVKESEARMRIALFQDKRERFFLGECVSELSLEGN